LSERGDSRYVYFYRIIGCDNELQYRAEIVCLDEKLKSLGNYIRFDKAIHLTTDSSLIDQTRKLFDQVPLRDFSNGALVNLLETRGYFSLTPNKQFTLQIKAAFGVMLNLYLTNQPTINISIIVNFLTKILLWLKDYGKQICKESSHNPKLVYWGSPKEHEIYFLILMSLIGCDVLVLNTSFDDNFDKVDKQKEFSLLNKKANEIPIGAFPAKPSEGKKGTGIEPPKSEKVEENLPKSQSKLALNDHIIVVKLKKNENVFNEILVPLSKRSGYVGKPYPIIPAFFVRYIGVATTVDDWEAEYYNGLYNLDKALQMSGAYIKFINGIPTPYAAESTAIPHKLIDYPYKDRFDILEQILQSNILFQTHDELLDNTLKQVFVDIATLFAERNSNINLSILLNFDLKLVTWLNRYLPELFSSSKGFDYERNPKVLFYGNIKPHEIYLLYAFHKIGCDVLFVHSQEDGDKPFQSFDLHQQITKLIKNTHSLPLASFPQVEQVIRKSTVAYNASKEIEEVIYSEDVGLYQPWQFESYLTQPITLKTTYDELKILWREHARIRPEFKVQNKKVYVPNLFAKINGVNENIDNYWQDIKALSSASNTRLISDVPFSQISYTKQELYQTAYLLNQHGLFDEAKVVKSKHYKLSYLKGPLQHFLIAKINELILSGMFLGTVDEKFKLKILMTILTMDDQLVKLIEMFDYPQEIPKVIVYDNEKETFSESDAIVLAYFNIIGLDIVIFTPTNYKTIEQHIRPSFLDVHQLPLVKFDLAIPALNNITSPTTRPGLLSRILKLR
jgi:hypothetical protein